ncbi:nucleolar complex protein 2 homolog [Styela clava]
MDLSSMTVEDFMKTDWGSDNDESEEMKVETGSSIAKNTKKKKTGQKKILKDKAKTEKNSEINANTKPGLTQQKTVSSHQKVLDNLQDKDPEFYKFLKQEDGSLLKFDESDFDIDGDDDDDDSDPSDEDGDTGVHQLPNKLEEASDSDLEQHEEILSGSDQEMERSSTTMKDRIPVTDDMIDDWKTKLMDPKSSRPSLRDLMKAFHAAILRFNDDIEDRKTKKQKPKTKFKVESGGTFNAVVGLCIRQVVPSLAKLLEYFPDKSSNKLILPTKSKSWIRLRDLIKVYLNDVIALNQLLLEPSVVCATLRHTILLVPYFISFPKITKLLLKFLIKTWSSADDESVRVLTFLCINRIIKLDKHKYLEPTMRQTYLAYVANCKFTTPSILPMINFMQQTLCELFSINPSMTYQLAFLYIRQLAIHLRKAMTVQKKENYQAVYNWQYVHCIGLWCRMVGHLYSHDIIKPLLYPLVQVSLGAIDLVPTARYFPLRYHIIRYLTMLSDATNTYIPLLPYITKPLRLAEFSKKKGGLMMQPLNFSTILKLSNSQLKESSYRSSTMDEIYNAFMDYINTQAHSISFPEMMVPTVISMKKYMKKCKMQNYVKLVRQIIEKVEENSKYILDKRSDVSFGVADVTAVTAWERTQKTQGVPFHKHYNHYKKLHHRESQHAAADKNRIVEERLPTIDRKKFMEASKKRDKEEMGDLFADDADNLLENVGENLEKLIQEGKSFRKRKTSTIRKRKAVQPNDNESLSGSDVGGYSDDEISDEGTDLNNGNQKPESSPSQNKKQKIDVSDDEPDIVEEFEFSSDEEN